MQTHFFRTILLTFFALTAWQVTAVAQTTVAESDLDALLRDFHHYSGAKLVFQRDDLPDGRYHDILKPLSDARKSKAAAICLREARKYPPGYFRAVGLEAVGVFAACVSKKGDGFRSFDKQLGGYRYFGVYNRANAVAAAYYSDQQLPLTFHHEIFHHIDSTQSGQTESWYLSSDDIFFQAAVSGRSRYAPPTLAADDLQSLRRACSGNTLRGAVSDYAAKSRPEDQAETARHIMSNLPDALLQAVEQPRLPGSQRILHVLREYERAVPDGPGVSWFVDAALDRAPHSIDRILSRLRKHANSHSGITNANRSRDMRTTLRALAGIDVSDIPSEKVAEAVRLAARVTDGLLQQRIQPDTLQQRFIVWGQEEQDGVNWRLRHDIQQFEADAARLKRIAAFDDQHARLMARTQMKNLQLIARYYAFIHSHWSVTPGTQQVFESARDTISSSLPDTHQSLSRKLRTTDLLDLAKQDLAHHNFPKTDTGRN